MTGLDGYEFIRTLTEDVEKKYSKTCIAHALVGSYFRMRMIMFGENAEAARANILDNLAMWSKTAKSINTGRRADRMLERIKNGTFAQHYKPRHRRRRKRRKS